jgi:hypothetical protein
MNVPAVANRTFNALSRDLAYLEIVERIVADLAAVADAADRARPVQEEIDRHNAEIFAHPLVREHSPCRAGCSSCCHTQLSVTGDEAELLA